MKGGKTFACPECSATFSEQGKLKLHTDRIHERKKPFICPVCTSTFAVKCDLKKHVDSVHEGKKPFRCSVCSAMFQSLMKHTAAVHERKKPFICTISSSTFSEKGTLKKHINSIHERKRPFSCPECCAAFSQKRRSKATHWKCSWREETKPYSSVCSSAFSTKQNLKQHIASIHEGKKLFPHSHVRSVLYFLLKNVISLNTL